MRRNPTVCTPAISLAAAQILCILTLTRMETFFAPSACIISAAQRSANCKRPFELRYSAKTNCAQVKTQFRFGVNGLRANRLSDFSFDNHRRPSSPSRRPSRTADDFPTTLVLARSRKTKVGFCHGFWWQCGRRKWGEMAWHWASGVGLNWLA